MNSIYQIEALKALRKGLEDYDKRHGWRGPVANIFKNNWQEYIQELIPDKSLNWKLAKVLKINKLNIEIETDNKKKAYVDFKDANWTRKKNFEEFLKVNDII